MLPKFSYVRPDTLKEVLGILDDNGARIHGGGTDLIGCLRDRVFTTDTLVSLTAIAELRGIEPDQGRRSSARRHDHHRRNRRRATSFVNRYGALADAAKGRRQPAASQPGHHRRQSLPETALLVLPR